MSRRLSTALKLITLAVIVISLPACDLAGSGDPELSAEELAQTLVAETLAIEHVVQTSVAQTVAVSQPTEDQGATKEREATVLVITDTPTITPSPTITLTPTPSVPVVSVSVDTNCRRGPGPPFDIIGALLVGGQAEVVGVAENGGYWIIKNPNRAGECWLWGNYATVEGQTAGLPRFTPPPTPTPSFTPTPIYNWTGTWTTSWGVTGFPHETYVINFTQTNAAVSGSFTVGTIVVSLSGTLSADYLTLTGTWTSPSPADSGPFVFKLVSSDQFIGNMNSGTYEWCGHRAGAGLPSPCMGP
jgi:hypothetical protein